MEVPSIRRSFLKCVDKCLPQPDLARARSEMPERESSERAERSMMTNHSNDLVRVEPAWNKFSRLSKMQYDTIVSAATPPERWFTPRDGWPQNVRYAGPQPVNLMPTWEEDHDYFLPESASLGVLKVELLETDGLASMDFAGFENDVYSVVIFEDSVAATRPIRDVNSPRFHEEVARAFRFPVLSPHSSLYIGLFDSDEDELINSTFSNLNHLVDGIDKFVKVCAAGQQSRAKQQAPISTLPPSHIPSSIRSRSSLSTRRRVRAYGPRTTC